MPQPDRLGDVPGGDLAPRQRAVREVVERPLADRRLVDRVHHDRRLRDLARPRDGDEHGVVRRPDDPADDLDVALAEGLERRRAVEHGDAGLVDVVAVAPRADVALRIERRAAQRAGRPAGGDDPGRPRDE